MLASADLARLEAIVDSSGVAGRIEALLAPGVRPRQLSVRSLLIGMLASQADGRPAHLRRVHEALVSLPGPECARLGVTTIWKSGPHVLTYRQVAYTFGRVVEVLSKQAPDGTPSEALGEIVDTLVEASIADEAKSASACLAVDWTDLETWALAPHSDGLTADVEASWGHRRSHAIGERDEVFYGYYFSAAVMVADDGACAAPELIRRITMTSCSVDPVPAMVPVLRRLACSGVTIGDILADSAYAHRIAVNWALPIRALGAAIVTDLHPSDRGPRGTYAGAILANGNLYCPATPKAVLDIAPLKRGASADETAAHDTLTATAANYKLGPITRSDAEGYHRVACPAVAAKLRCPHRPESMTLPYDRPSVIAPPDPAPTCCSQKTITVAPSINPKTAQKHDYPGPAWRASYARRSGVERAYSTMKDRASNDVERGWCRLNGLTPILLFLAAASVARNLRVADAFEARVAADARRTAAGQPPHTRRRRRKTLADLVGASP